MAEKSFGELGGSAPLRKMEMVAETEAARRWREYLGRIQGAMDSGAKTPDALRGIRQFLFQFANADPNKVSQLNTELQLHVDQIQWGLAEADRLQQEGTRFQAFVVEAGHPTLDQSKITGTDLATQLEPSSFHYEKGHDVRSPDNSYAWQNVQRLFEVMAKYLEPSGEFGKE